MSKIFRLYKQGTNTYQDWNSSSAFPYNSTNRDTIEDPDGASASHEITSIPSPFARIDLVKTAFKEVCKKDKKTKKCDLDGATIFHKMVSDTLDVAEIFFNLEKFSDKVEVIKWDSSRMLKELADSENEGHQYYADALTKYMKSDAKAYNFEKLNCIYLLNYVNGPDELNIIGATSPATMFFSNANDLSYVDDIFFGNDIPFDEAYQPLYKRDFELVKCFFTLRKSIDNFASLFPELDEYLAETFRCIKDQAKKDVLNKLTSTDLAQFSPITIHNNHQNDDVEVLGNKLYQKKGPKLGFKSDFTIRTTKATKHSPLVLPVETGNKYTGLQYVTAKWVKDNHAPFRDNEVDITKRTLPYEGSRIPYLTISDFLEDTIIRVPHTINTENYFTGNLKIDEKELSYLLPLKPLLFEYFTPDEIKGNMNDGNPMVEMDRLASNSIKITIRIPITGDGNISYIEYVRIYYNNRKADVDKNEGGITEFKFTGFVMPQVEFINENDAIYNISCVQSVSGRVEFDFYNGEKKISIKDSTCRNENQGFPIKAKNYLIEHSNFEYIQVRNINCQGVLLPIFKQQQNIDKFEFAIDLGTSNTHIEFRKGNEKPEKFSFTSKDRQLCEMFIPDKNEFGYIENLIVETEVIEKDFIPGEIGRFDFQFPTRTILSCAKNLNWTEVIEPFTLTNLPFTYDKRSELSYNNYKYNIKWGDVDNPRVIELYVNCLMLIIRNKVLLNNGDLKNTKITWFYPISMAPKRLNKLKETWDEAYKKYFGENGGTSFMTESAAPIQYFFSRYATTTDLVNIDIGGGTTDIAFAKDKSINYVTSFRFAANALFEDSFAQLNDSNGIVDRYKNVIYKILEEKNISELISVYDSPNNAHPSNMASFLFGLKDNNLVHEAKIEEKNIDFNHILQEDEDFKIVFIIFYSAIIYHIAHIIKALKIDVPRHITFSGNGSKVIRIITTDSKILARYTKLIFEKVLGEPYGKELEILGLDKTYNPKESTCKGGIIGKEDDANRDKAIVFKGDCTGIVSSSDTYATITEEFKKKIVVAVEKFFDFILKDMNKAFNFDKNFGVKKQSVDTAKETCKKDIMTFLEKGLSQCRKELESDNETIEETFFFYPIEGVLNAISTEIYNKLSN